jgi:hypothetical protein
MYYMSISLKYFSAYVPGRFLHQPKSFDSCSKLNCVAEFLHMDEDIISVMLARKCTYATLRRLD